MRRALQKYIEDPLSEALIQGTLPRPADLEVYLGDTGIYYRVLNAEGEAVGRPLEPQGGPVARTRSLARRPAVVTSAAMKASNAKQRWRVRHSTDARTPHSAAGSLFRGPQSSPAAHRHSSPPPSKPSTPELGEMVAGGNAVLTC